MKLAHSIQRQGQRGVALVVALLFLLVVTVISVIAASNSSLGLKMSANMADSYSSFQSAEGGIIAALSLAGTGAADPFTGDDELDPFSTFDPNSDHPLANVDGGNGPSTVDVDVFIMSRDLVCPRSASGADSSAGRFSCDYYRVASEHEVQRKARTKVQLGVVKTVLGSGTP